ncbi:hypothetical protein [Klebsiella sp. A52]|uniref:hypothetical protein n=1 Tax=Klebsiella sp. A52 TaxID=2834819 RepID=UPI001BCCD937|nr:hypothetical protein [Klebsiella sp. A52]QVJ11893.1 hypothetical protein KGA69_10390 [Klebsiella sp. A52]
MAATPYPGYPTMRTRSPAAQRELGKPSRMAATPYPGYPTMRTRSPAERSACRGNLPGWRLHLIRATQRCVPVARLSAARAGETFPDGGYTLSGLPNDAHP